MSDLLDVQQAADYLGGIHRATVYRLVADKKLRIVKIRGATRFRRTELDRFLRAAERSREASRYWMRR